MLRSLRSQQRRISSRRSNRLLRGLRFEPLESRDLMAFNVSLTGTDVLFTGSSGDDSLTLQNDGGLLRHNLPLGGGIESPYDLSPEPHVQSLAVASITDLSVVGNAGSDSVLIATNLNFNLNALTAGGAFNLDAESVTVNESVVMAGGDFTTSGVNFTKNNRGTITTGGGVAQFDQTGSISLFSPVVAASISSISAQTFWTQFGVNLATTAGDFVVTTVGDIMLQGKITAADPSLSGPAQIALTSTTGDVNFSAIQTDGGDFTASGKNVTSLSNLSTISTVGGSASGDIVLTASGGGAFFLRASATGASFSATGGESFDTRGRVDTVDGDVFIDVADFILFELDNIKAVDLSPGETADVTLVAGGDVTLRQISTDGGSFTSTGSNFTTTTNLSRIQTSGGAVVLNHTGDILLSAENNIGSFQAIGAASFTTGPFDRIDVTHGSITISVAGAISLGGDVVAKDAGIGDGTISLAAGGAVATKRLTTDGGSITASGTTFTSTGSLDSVDVVAGDIDLNFSGAVSLGGLSVTAQNLNSSGSTFATLPNVFVQVADTVTLDHGGAISIGGTLDAGHTDVLQNVTTTFESTSVLYVDLVDAMPIFVTAGSVVFATGSHIYVEASNADVETGSTYDALVATTGTITNNGYILENSFYDNEFDEVIFLSGVISTPPGQTLRLDGYVKGEIDAVCAGACTLSLGTTITPFGPTLELRDALNNLVVSPAPGIGLVTGVTITGALNSTDSLTIDYRNGNPLAYNGQGFGLSYDGLGGTGTDSLSLVDSNGAVNGSFSFDDVSMTAIDANSGSMTVDVGGDVSAIDYAGLEPISINMPIVNLAFVLTAGDDAASLRNFSSTQSRISGATFEMVTFNTPTGSLSVNGSGGTDSVTFPGPLTSFTLPGASLNINSEAVSVQTFIITGGGAISSQGSGNFTTNLGYGVLNAGAGAVSINHGGTVSVQDPVTAGSYTVAGAASYINGGNVTTSNGNISISAANGIAMRSADASGGLAAAITLNAGIGNIALTGNLRTDGGGITTSGVNLTNVDGNLVRANLLGNPKFGPIQLNQTGLITLQGPNVGASFTATAGGTFSTTGTGDSITTNSGSISITAPGGITLAAGVTAADATFTGSILLNAGANDISIVGDLRSNGGAITTVSKNFSNANGNTIRANLAGNPTYGAINMTHTGSIAAQGTVMGGSLVASAGTTFATTGSGDLITLRNGGANITAPGGITLTDNVDVSAPGSTTAAVTLNASPSGNVVVRGVLTDGGNFTSSGAAFTNNGTIDVLDSIAGILTLNHSGNINIKRRLEALSYVVSGGGNMVFESTSELFLRTNVVTQSTAFVMTGLGNLTFDSGSKLFVDAVGTGSVVLGAQYHILTVDAELTYNGTTQPVTGARASAVDSVMIDLLNDTIDIKLKP